MKKHIIALILAISLAFTPVLAHGADPGLFWATGLTGGLAGYLDKINSTTGKVIGGSNYPLETGDAAIVITSNQVWFFRYDASSTASEDLLKYQVIKPDNLGDEEPGRWIKKYHISSWLPSVEVQILDGVALLTGEGNYTLAVESGNFDNLDKLAGLEEGHLAVLAPADGNKTIFIKNGTYLKLQDGKDFELNHQYDRIQFISIGSDICVELQRSSGGD